MEEEVQPLEEGGGGGLSSVQLAQRLGHVVLTEVREARRAGLEGLLLHVVDDMGDDARLGLLVALDGLRRDVLRLAHPRHVNRRRHKVHSQSHGLGQRVAAVSDAVDLDAAVIVANDGVVRREHLLSHTDVDRHR